MKTTFYLLIAALTITSFSSCKKKIIQPTITPIETEDTTSTETENKLSRLTITVTGMKNANGKLNFALYNSSATFNDPNLAFREIFSDALANSQIFVVDSLPAGDYAFAVFHDENQNNEIDKNWMGVPTEGFAFSNNAMGSFGPPSFNQAKVSVPEKSDVAQTVTLKFF